MQNASDLYGNFHFIRETVWLQNDLHAIYLQ